MLPASTVHPLQIGTQHVIQGIIVTMLEANHCPGAALIHFQLPGGQCHLHTGDFRASNHMRTYPILLNHKIDLLYLDTTYCNSKYRYHNYAKFKFHFVNQFEKDLA